jgi:hypothetical protein
MNERTENQSMVAISLSYAACVAKADGSGRHFQALEAESNEAKRTPASRSDVEFEILLGGKSRNLIDS